jgi:hypothetical protein
MAIRQLKIALNADRVFRYSKTRMAEVLKIPIKINLGMKYTVTGMNKRAAAHHRLVLFQNN